MLVRELRGRRLGARHEPRRRGGRTCSHDVLGLGVDQFSKVVLLPQGEFAAFLRADAEDRRPLLERLFGTDRFAAVQQWLRESQAGLRPRGRGAARDAARCPTLLARADQARRATVGAHCRAPTATPAAIGSPRCGRAGRGKAGGGAGGPGGGAGARAARGRRSTRRPSPRRRCRHASGNWRSSRARLRAGDAADHRSRGRGWRRRHAPPGWPGWPIRSRPPGRARPAALATDGRRRWSRWPGRRRFRPASRPARPSTEPARRRRYRTTPPCWSAAGPPSSWSASSQPSSARSPRRAP